MQKENPQLTSLDLTALEHTHKLREGPSDLQLGKSQRLTLNRDTVIDIYPTTRLISVKTPLSTLKIAGIEKVTASDNAIEFQAVLAT